MSDGPPGTPPGNKPGGKRPAIGLQIKLPCVSLEEVKLRYGEDLRQGKFFIRTKSPRAKDTLVRLEAQLSTGAPAFRAAAVVASVQDPPEPGMRLQILGVDDAGRELIVALGGKPPPALKVDAAKPAPAKPSITSLPGIKAPPPKPAPPAAQRPAVIAPPPPVVSKPPPPPPEAVEPPKPPPPPPPPADKAEKPAEEPAPKPAKKGPIIGIDLGTTNSAAAVVKEGKPFVIPSREGYNTIPSIVAVNDKGKVIVGHPAKGQLLINPKTTVYGAKRLVGRQFELDGGARSDGPLSLQIVAGPRGEAAVQLGDRQLSLAGDLRAGARRGEGDGASSGCRAEVNRAVITVPAYYNDNQRNAVREAGELAGLDRRAHLERADRRGAGVRARPQARAAGPRLRPRRRHLRRDACCELHGNVYEVVSTGGDTFLGGVDFDKVIVDHLLARFKEKNGIDFPGDRVALQRVTDAAERAKIALSEQLEYKVKVPFVALIGDKPYDLDATVTRARSWCS